MDLGETVCGGGCGPPLRTLGRARIIARHRKARIVHRPPWRPGIGDCRVLSSPRSVIRIQPACWKRELSAFEMRKSLNVEGAQRSETYRQGDMIGDNEGPRHEDLAADWAWPTPVLRCY